MTPRDLGDGIYIRGQVDGVPVTFQQTRDNDDNHMVLMGLTCLRGASIRKLDVRERQPTNFQYHHIADERCRVFNAYEPDDRDTDASGFQQKRAMHTPPFYQVGLVRPAILGSCVATEKRNKKKKRRDETASGNKKAKMVTDERSSLKKSYRTPRASRKELDSLRKDVKSCFESIGSKLDRFFSIVDTAISARQRPVTIATTCTVTGNTNPKRVATLVGIPLSPIQDTVFTHDVDDDTLSLMPGERERSELLGEDGASETNGRKAHTVPIDSDSDDTKINALEEDDAKLSVNVSELEQKADAAEQYSHRNCLRVSGKDANTACGSSSEMSSGRYSNLSLLGHNKQTNELHVLVHLHDVTGRPRSRGGDVVTVRALKHSPSGSMATKDGEPIVVVAGTVIDNGDGTYVASVQVLWTGPTEIRAIIAAKYQNTCRRFLAMTLYGNSAYSLQRPHGVSVIFQETNITEKTPCSAVPHVIGYDKICNLTKHNFNMTIYCGHPTSRHLSCSSPIAIWQRGKINELKKNDSGEIFSPVAEILNSTYSLNISQSNWNSNMKRYFVEVKSEFYFEPEQTECNNRPALLSWQDTYPTGLGVNQGWRMLHCRHKQVRDTDTLRRCMAGKRVYFMGDSTVRQYFQTIRSQLNSTYPIRKEVNRLLFTDPIQNMHFEWSIHSMPYSCGDLVAKCVSSSIANTLYEILHKEPLHRDEVQTQTCRRNVTIQ
ncbi:uncharacterized protein LOC128225900 [Mya arenaria]|uniref:uncharacterized protein LOC128225900 n=1 Tax=Mya arenaria TaxID=6604 RepID=UPI0022E84341|nr:uncharacterized protein LOC128225900 [Mya arenaria]